MIGIPFKKRHLLRLSDYESGILRYGRNDSNWRVSSLSWSMGWGQRTAMCQFSVGPSISTGTLGQRKAQVSRGASQERERTSVLWALVLSTRSNIISQREFHKRVGYFSLHFSYLHRSFLECTNVCLLVDALFCQLLFFKTWDTDSLS